MAQNARIVRFLSPSIPYLAVAIGIYGLSNAFAAMGLYHAGMLLVILSLMKRREITGIRSGNNKWLYATALVFAAGGVILYFAWPYLESNSSLIADRLHYFGINKDNSIYFAVYFCLVNSVLEETFWRGYLRQDFIHLGKNDVFFAGYHSFLIVAFIRPIWALPVFAACAFAGWLWRMLYRMDGSLKLPILTHAVADASIILAVYLRVFR